MKAAQEYFLVVVFMFFILIFWNVLQICRLKFKGQTLFLYFLDQKIHRCEAV